MRRLFLFLSISALVTGCFDSEYTRLVKNELAVGERKDSILFGIYFGDSRKDFFTKCYNLNQQRLVSQGPANSSVQYVFLDSTFHKPERSIQLLFYPRFDGNQNIKSMDVEFSYSAWAPWNDDLQSDKLFPKVLEMLENWYGGNRFIDIEVKGKNIPAKIDGNRRILVYVKDTETVLVRIQDILHPEYKHSISK